VTRGVVHRLEIVQVGEEHRGQALVSSQQDALHPVEEQHPVGQPRQRVVHARVLGGYPRAGGWRDGGGDVHRHADDPGHGTPDVTDRLAGEVEVHLAGGAVLTDVAAELVADDRLPGAVHPVQQLDKALLTHRRYGLLDSGTFDTSTATTRSQKSALA